MLHGIRLAELLFRGTEHSCALKHRKIAPESPAGVQGEKRNLTPLIAYYIGTGLAKLLSARFNKPANELKVSVSCHHVFRPAW